jgi:hypothetical protein
MGKENKSKRKGKSAEKVEAVMTKVNNVRKITRDNKTKKPNEVQLEEQEQAVDEHFEHEFIGDAIVLTPLTAFAKNLIRDIERTPKNNDPDPMVVFAWNTENINMAVAAFNAANPPNAALPHWFGIQNGSFPLNPNQLQGGILSRLLADSGTTGNIISNFAIAPNTLSQYSNIKVHCGFLALDPFWAPLNPTHLPLANMYSVLDRKQATTATPDPVPPPPPPYPTIIN